MNRRKAILTFSDILLVLLGGAVLLSSCSRDRAKPRSTPLNDCGHGCHTGHRE